jgi:thiol-disulfide isomerase/thioredoxin
MTIAAAHGNLFGKADAADGVSRELAAIGRATEWLNSAPLTADSLRGKVVLVDFWTYTCINWLRTLPYVRAWAGTYGRNLVVVGVHTPEFAVEHDVRNVRLAVARLGVDYPVVIDNDYAIWRAFRNQYWPALYFIDGRGRNRERHFGEGEYQRSELIIQRLLADSGAPPAGARVAPVESRGEEVAADWANLRSPETYLGYERAERFASGGLDPDRRRTFAAPRRLQLNQWSLAGEWTVGRQAAALHSANGRLAYRFHARDLHLVMGPARRGTTVRYRVSLDGQPPGSAHGTDVDESGSGAVAAEPRLYQLIRQRAPIADRTFEIEFLDAGVDTLAFTFG